MQFHALENFKVCLKQEVCLKNYNPKWLPPELQHEANAFVRKETMDVLKANRKKLREKQELFWASHTYSMLIILQGMNAAGKDGVISHVMSAFNPQGCEVKSFKVPTQEELNHNFLWRHMKALPERGRIGIFNRSYYEDVIVVKVEPEVFAKQKLPPELVDKHVWKCRYEDINSFERHLTRNGTLILKFFLNISKEEQTKQLLERIKEPDKHWKFNPNDMQERGKWREYEKAYEEAISETSTEYAPWYIIPADHRWICRAAISEILLCQLEKLDLKYPKLDEEQCAAFEKAKQELQKEKK